MIMRQLSLFFGILIFILNTTSGIYIEITGGQVSGVPIAVTEFDSELASFSKIIRQNLSHSGQFAPLPANQNLKNNLNYSAWQELGVEYLLHGKFQQDQVTFELANIFAEKVELSEAYDNINPNNIRELAHHVSDLIFEKILGIKGFFSTRIAYIKVLPDKIYQLCIADSDGFNAKVIFESPEPILSPAWSPDGKKIACVSFENQRAAILVLDIKSGTKNYLTSFSGINSSPSWSPDGNRIALVLSKTGVPKIYIKNLVTGDLTRVTSGSSIDTEPMFTPDGKSIIFTSNRGGQPQIYELDLQAGPASQPRRLTFEGDYNASPRITPDGQQLIMMHKRSDGRYSIAVQNLKTNKVKILTDSNQDETPSLAPNGMMVIYGSKEAGNGILGAVSLDGRFHMRLPAPEGDGSIKSPAWSPFLT